MSDRITAEDLRALCEVAREFGVLDFASGDTRVVFSKDVPRRAPIGTEEPPLRTDGSDETVPEVPFMPGTNPPRRMTPDEQDLFAGVA